MIALYFDKEFVTLFNERKDHADPVIYDFIYYFIKRVRGVELFVNFDSLEELKELILKNEYFNLLSEISSPQLMNFKGQLLSTSFYEKGAITKLFFVENCDETVLQEKYNCYFISNNSLSDKWKLFLSDRDDGELVIKSDANPVETHVFHSWADFNYFSHKVQNILVCDLYVLTNKKDQKIRNNIVPCLNELIKDTNGKIKDLTFIAKSLADTSTKKKELQDIWQDDDINITTKYLEPLLKSINHISFVKYDDTKNTKADAIHNRFILTNYFFIRLEAGFNIFKDNGKVNHSDYIKFDSVLKNRTRNIVIEVLKNLKLYYSQLKQKDTRAIGPDNVLDHYYFYPELKCRFLD